MLSGLTAFRPAQNTHVGVAGETELALTQSVSGNYHAVLGVHALDRTHADRAGSRACRRHQPSLLAAAVCRRRECRRARARDAGTFVHDRRHHASRLLRDTAGTPCRRHHSARRTGDDDAAERSMAVPDRAIGAGRVSRTGARGAARALGAARCRGAVGVAVDIGIDGQTSRDARTRFRRTGNERAAPAVLRAASDSDGRGGRRAARRVCQSRGPVDRAIERATAGDRGEALAGRRARPDRASAPDRDRAPRRRRWRRRTGARIPGGRSAACDDVPRPEPDRAGCRAERTHARVRGCGHDHHGRVMRSASGARREPGRLSRIEAERSLVSIACETSGDDRCWPHRSLSSSSCSLRPACSCVPCRSSAPSMRASSRIRCSS